MDINEEIIEEVLFKHAEISELDVYHLVNLMKKKQKKVNDSFEEFVDRIL